MNAPGHTILLVDDDVDFLEATRFMLASAGFRVLCCEDAAAALELLGREKCDLVITDLMMSSLDSGFSFAQAIKKDPRLARLPVILATSASSASGFDFHPRSAGDLQQMCADAFFDKPLQKATLVSKINQLLDHASPGTPQ